MLCKSIFQLFGHLLDRKFIPVVFLIIIVHEIAEKLSISIKTVEANMGKELKHFRLYLKDYAEAV